MGSGGFYFGPMAAKKSDRQAMREFLNKKLASKRPR